MQAKDERRTIIMGGIAGLYADQKNYEKAFEWYNKIREEFPNTNVSMQAEQAIRMVKAEQEKDGHHSGIFGIDGCVPGNSRYGT